MSESNAGSASTQESSGSTESQNGKVSYETYQKVLNEAKKAKELAKALAEERAKIEEQKLKEQNEWKTLAEQYKTKAEQEQKIRSQLEEAQLNAVKLNEFEKHLGGRLKNRDYATFVDFEKIVLNPESKSVDEQSVKTVVNEFLKSHSSLVEFKGTGTIPNAAANGFAQAPAKDLSSMTKEELEKTILELAKSGKLK